MVFGDSPKRSTPSFDEKELPNLPTAQTSPGLRQRVRRICLRLWIWELLSLTLCVACVSAIVAILLRYDGRPLPTWRYGLTINGVISVLAGVAKASLILPVAESIGQLKWHWFSNGTSRAMMDFEYLDVASRGPWGCLILLCRPRQWGLVSMGALITVAALVMEPSLQFIPSYPLRMVAVGQATLSRSIEYNDVTYGTSPNFSEEGEVMETHALGLSTQNSVYRVLYGMVKASSADAQPICPTGDCTWPSFSSLAVCSHCTDLSDKVGDKMHSSVLNPNDPRWWLPHDVGLAENNLFTSVDWHESMVYNTTSGSAILNAFYMYHNSSVDVERTKVKPQASECLLYFCVKEFATRVTAGVYSEEVLSSWPDPHMPVPGAPDMMMHFRSEHNTDGKYAGDLVLRPIDAGEEYRVKWIALQLVWEWLHNTLGNIEWSGEVGWAMADYAIDQAIYEITVGDRNDNVTGPERVSDVIATALTTAVRQRGNSSTAVTGEALREASHVKARWGWAILPVALVGLACCFLATTLMLTASKGIPIWKTSALATLAHGLSDAAAGSIAANRLDDVENKARRHVMLLDTTRQNWKVQLREG